MATINEEIVTGRKFRKLINEANMLWQRISFWTKASDVEFDDGQTAESKLGAIKGITADFNVTEEGYVADMTALGRLYNDMGGFSFYPEKLTQEQYNTLSEEIKATPGMIFIIVKE